MCDKFESFFDAVKQGISLNPSLLATFHTYSDFPRGEGELEGILGRFEGVERFNVLDSLLYKFDVGVHFKSDSVSWEPFRPCGVNMVIRMSGDRFELIENSRGQTCWSHFE